MKLFLSSFLVWPVSGLFRVVGATRPDRWDAGSYGRRHGVSIEGTLQGSPLPAYFVWELTRCVNKRTSEQGSLTMRGAAMNVKIDIDCTPEEARTFLGLPDVKPLQEAMLKEVEAKMLANLQAMDPETMFKTWLPAGMQGLEQMQRMFWSNMAGSDDANAKNKKD